MSGNLTPWIVLACVVAASLYFKGYFRPPSIKPSSPGLANQTDHQTPSRGVVNIDELARLGSYTLGIAFAKAVRAEAESAIAGKIASDAAQAIHARFTDPFSAPGQSGPESQPATPPVQ